MDRLKMKLMFMISVQERHENNCGLGEISRTDVITHSFVETANMSTSQETFY